VAAPAARSQESAGARCWRQFALLLAYGRMHHRRPVSPASCPRSQRDVRTAAAAAATEDARSGDSRGLCKSITRKAKPAGIAHRILWLVTHGAAATITVPASAPSVAPAPAPPSPAPAPAPARCLLLHALAQAGRNVLLWLRLRREVKSQPGHAVGDSSRCCSLTAACTIAGL